VILLVSVQCNSIGVHLRIADQEGGPFKDGGLYDRTGLVAWRRRRSLRGNVVPPALIHLIARSSNFSGADDVESTGGCRTSVAIVLL
jgi:hypothetical protein